MRTRNPDKITIKLGSPKKHSFLYGSQDFYSTPRGVSSGSADGEHAAASLARHHHLPARAFQRNKRLGVRCYRWTGQVAPVHYLHNKVLVTDVGLDHPVRLVLHPPQQHQQLSLLHFNDTRNCTSDDNTSGRLPTVILGLPIPQPSCLS